MSKSINSEALAVIFDIYGVELENAHRMNPERYCWPISELPTVMAKMKDAFVRGSCSIDGEGWKRTCKRLKIKHTRKALWEYAENNPSEFTDTAS